MGDIINFAAAVQARRVDAIEAERESARARNRAARREELHDAAERAGAGLSGHVLADAVANMEDTRERGADRKAQARCPAYCDPANERCGGKFAATRDVPMADIAKRIRADIRDALGSGLLPAGLKTSVRLSRFAGGCAIDVTVTALPADFPMLSPKYASWCRQFPNDRWNAPLPLREQRSQALADMLDRLEAIHKAYNRDNSDSQSDYFDVRYYGSVSIDRAARDPLETTEIAAARADYWADDANRF